MSNDTVVSLAAPALVPPPHGASALRGAAAGRGGGPGGVRGAPVVVRSREAPRRSPAGGAQRALARAQDSHRARRGGCTGPQGAQPLGLPGAVPLLGGAALRSVSVFAVSINRAAATQAVPAASNGVPSAESPTSATSTPWPRAITPRIPVCGVSTVDCDMPSRNSSIAPELARSNGPTCGITAPPAVLWSSPNARTNICMCGNSLRRTRWEAAAAPRRWKRSPDCPQTRQAPGVLRF